MFEHCERWTDAGPSSPLSFLTFIHWTVDKSIFIFRDFIQLSIEILITNNRDSDQTPHPLIWVCTFCLCPKSWMPGLKGLEKVQQYGGWVFN